MTELLADYPTSNLLFILYGEMCFYCCVFVLLLKLNSQMLVLHINLFVVIQGAV